MVTNLESGSRRPGMERSRKRTPIIHRSKGACTIGLVLAMGFAVFGVGGAAAGDGTYARHAREQRLAGIALAHRTAEELVLAMKPHTSKPPATDPVTTPPAPAATAPTTPAPAPATTPQPAAATTTPTTPAPTDTTTTTATTPAPTTTDTTTTTATTPAPTDTTTTTTDPTTTDPTTTDPTTTDPSAIGANPSAQVGSSGSGAVCYGRCVTSGQTGAVPSAVPSSTTTASSGSFSLTTSPLATAAPTTGTVTPTAPVNAVSSTTLPPSSTGTQNNTPSASTTPPLRSGLKNLTSPSSLLNVTRGNSTTKRSGTGAVGGTGTAASGGATGAATAAAAGTLVASTAATGTGSGTHGATPKHATTKHQSSGGAGITAPFAPVGAAFVTIVNHIPTWLWVALGAACALALAFGALAFRSSRRARKQARQFAAISAAAQTDALTGIFNRRGFMDAAERELARASRYDRQFVLAYVDVRGLKAVNDTEGHLMGDELIKAVAGLMKESARADDVVGRIGGDEFALLLGEQTAEGAEPVLRRIRARVEERRSGMEIRVPWELTIGIAAFPEDGTTLEELLGVADRRLYEQRGIALR
jgi:diguanylate cyclase (GGDEF)-like protein